MKVSVGTGRDLSLHFNAYVYKFSMNIFIGEGLKPSPARIWFGKNKMSKKLIRSKERKLNRIKGFDYSGTGAYFVTSCVLNRIPCFGQVKDGEMALNELGRIVKKKWEWLSNQYAYVDLGEFVVMPNHVHGIIYINASVGTGRDLSLQKTQKIKSLSELIGAFKTTSSKEINESKQLPDFRWQRSFHDHIIRNENELEKISEYIKYNPLNWDDDEFNITIT